MRAPRSDSRTFVRPKSRRTTAGGRPTARDWALAAAAAWALAGCGGAATPSSEPEPQPAPAAPTDTTTAHDTAAAAREPVERRGVTLCAGGDAMLGSNLDTTWTERYTRWLERPVPALPDPDSLLAPLRPAVEGAGIVLVNVEGAIGEGPAWTKCPPSERTCYAFRQPVSAAAALVRFAAPGRLVANLANNHALDTGLPGLAETIEHLEAAGARVTGADTLATLVSTAAGDTVAVLGFSPARAGPDPRDLEAVRRHVGRAAARYRRVVVTMHMGAEGEDAARTRDTTEWFMGEERGNVVGFAHAAIDAGASLVVGHGPHVLRAAEWRGRGLILYSLANLVTYGPFNVLPPRDVSAIACAVLGDDGGVTAAVLHSTRLEPPGLAALDSLARAPVRVDSLSRLDFPATGVHVLADGRMMPPTDRATGVGHGDPKKHRE